MLDRLLPLLATLTVLALAGPASAQPPLETAADVMRLHTGGMPTPALIDAIEANPPFLITGEQLELMRAAGVPREVLGVLAQRALGVTSARATPDAAPPSAAELRTGGMISAGVGINACLKDETAGCEDVGLGGSLDLSIGLRPVSWVSVAFDFTFAGNNLKEGDHFGDSASSAGLAAMLALRGHFPAGPHLEIELTAGFGYAAWKVDTREENFSAAWDSFLAYKLGFAVSVYVAPNIALGLGVTGFVHPDNGESCFTTRYGDELCGDTDGDVAEHVTGTLRATLLFQ